MEIHVFVSDPLNIITIIKLTSNRGDIIYFYILYKRSAVLIFKTKFAKKKIK